MNIKLEDIKEKLTNVSGVNYREFKCGDQYITLVFLECLYNPTFVNEYILKPLFHYDKNITEIKTVGREVIMAGPAEEVTTLEEALQHIFSGDVLLFFHNLNKVIYCASKGYESRKIDVPPTETVIKGPRAGFTEDIETCISSIRLRLKTSDLKIENFTSGKKSQTKTAMLYINGVAPENLVNYVREKIHGINDIDYIMYSQNLEESMSCKGTPFETIGNTEKPDTAAQKISEGRVVVLYDGLPFAIFAPHFFLENFHATDDYTLNKYMAAVGRILRFGSFMIATLTPGLYLALVSHHFKLIPSILLFKIAIFRAGVPLPTVVELIVMIIVFQIIRGQESDCPNL